MSITTIADPSKRHYLRVIVRGLALVLLGVLSAGATYYALSYFLVSQRDYAQALRAVEAINEPADKVTKLWEQPIPEDDELAAGQERQDATASLRKVLTVLPKQKAAQDKEVKKAVDAYVVKVTEVLDWFSSYVQDYVAVVPAERACHKSTEVGGVELYEQADIIRYLQTTRDKYAACAKQLVELEATTANADFKKIIAPRIAIYKNRADVFKDMVLAAQDNDEVLYESAAARMSAILANEEREAAAAEAKPPRVINTKPLHDALVTLLKQKSAK